MHLAIVHNLPDKLHESVLVPLQRALGQHGDTVECVPATSLEVTIDANVQVQRRDGTVFAPDAVLGRVVSQASLVTVLGCLATSGVPVVNDPRARAFTADKVTMTLALTDAGVPVVSTALALPGAPWADQVTGSGWLPPFVVKPARGMQGKGVRLATSSEALHDLAAEQHDEMWLVQPQLGDGRDVRVFVVDGVALAAMARTPTTGEWRANLHAGGTAVSHRLTAEEADVAIRAAVACGLVIAGVDLLLTPVGPAVLEVNPNPGIGIAAATGVDVLAAIADAVRRAAQSGPTLPERPVRGCHF